MSDINVPVPDDATPEQEDALIDRAIDEKIDGDLDGIFKDTGRPFGNSKITPSPGW